MGLDALQQHFTGLADAAADDHRFGIDHRAKIAQQLTQQAVDLFQDLQRHRIICLTGIENVLAGQIFHSAQAAFLLRGSQMLLGQPDDAGGGAILLGAATLAAVAGCGFVPVQHHMADLRAGTGGAVEQLTLNDHAAAYAGAQCDKNHVPAALAAALPEFAHGRHIGIVACGNGQAGQLRQRLAHIKSAPAQVDAHAHLALAVDGAGNADADAQDLMILARPVGSNGSGDIGQNLPAAVGGHRGDLPLFDHVADLVKICDLDGGAAQIHAVAVFHKGMSSCICFFHYTPFPPKKEEGL